MVDLKPLANSALRQRRSTPALIADALREAILSGVVKSGEPLRQDDIALQFGVSRIPVREALRELEGEGLITLTLHRGAVVSRLSRAELEEICEIRVALETTAVRLAIPHLSPDDVQRAARILDETDREVQVVAHWSEQNWKFHATLYAPAGRPRLLRMIKTLHNNVDRYLRLHVSLLNYKESGQAEHRQILAACERGDADVASRLLEQHIMGVYTLLGPFLDHDRQ